MGPSLALVALSIGMLLAAPAFAAALARLPRLMPMLDSFVLVTVGGIVGLHVVPQSAERAGGWAVIAAVTGLVLPVALHHIDDSIATSSGRRTRDLLLLGAFLAGSFVHACFDGTALAHAALEPALAVGVILHRLPMGLALWLLVRPRLGLGRTMLVVLALCSGTIVGAALGDGVLAHASMEALAIVQAFVGGSILHIVAESAPSLPTRHTTTSRVEPHDLQVRGLGLIGTGFGVFLLFAMEHFDADQAGSMHAHNVLTASATFVALASHVAPSVVLSFLIVGLLTALDPRAPHFKARSSRLRDAVTGMAGGLSHPLCACTVAPMYESLLARGTSPAAARAFLVAAPELGVPAVLVSLRLLGLPFTAARALGAAMIATWVGMSAPARGGTANAPSLAPLHERLRHGLRHAAIDAVDHVAPWLLLGLGAAALLEPLLDENLWSTIPSSVQTIGLAVAALPLYLCAAGSTVLAALLVHKGISIGAALALVLVGPATSIPTLALVRRHHGVRAAVTCALVVVVGAVCVGMVADAASQLIDGDIASTPRAALAFLHTASAQAPTQIPAPMGTPLPTVLQAVSLLVLGALVVASLARQGVRGFVLQIMSPQHTHVRDHTHGPGCDHDHGPAVVSDTRDVPRPPAAFPRSRGTTTKTAARVALSFDPRVPRYDADDDGNASER